MGDLFLLKVILAFLIAGTWISAATLLAERLGSRIGGLITNLPSNILITMIFFALVNDVHFAAAATRAVPVGMMINTLFMLIFILLIRSGLTLTVVLSIASWLIMAFIASQVQITSYALGAGVYILVTVAVYLVLEFGLHIPAAGRQQRRYTRMSLTLRALFAGGVVSGAIVVSRFAGPYLTGLIATFPAVLLSTMCILSYFQGAGFARATGKILVLSSSNIIVYAWMVSLTYPTLGIATGTLLSFITALAFVALLHPVIERVSRSSLKEQAPGDTQSGGYPA